MRIMKKNNKEETLPITDSQQFNKPADALIAAIRDYYQRIHGRTATKEDVKEHVNRIMEERA